MSRIIFSNWEKHAQMTLSNEIIYNGLNEDAINNWKGYDFAVIERAKVKQFIKDMENIELKGLDDTCKRLMLEEIKRRAGDKLNG